MDQPQIETLLKFMERLAVATERAATANENICKIFGEDPQTFFMNPLMQTNTYTANTGAQVYYPTQSYATQISGAVTKPSIRSLIEQGNNMNSMSIESLARAIHDNTEVSKQLNNNLIGVVNQLNAALEKANRILGHTEKATSAFEQV